MKKQAEKQLEKQNQRSLSDELTTGKQEAFMRLLITVIIEARLKNFYEGKEMGFSSDPEALNRIEAFLRELDGSNTCHIFAQAAYDCEIPMHSSFHFFRLVMEERDAAKKIYLKLQEAENFSAEEQVFVPRIQAVLAKFLV